MKELMKLQNISFEIKDVLLFDDINGHVQEGDRIGIIGKNGAGKSTLLQIIYENLVPSEGSIIWMEDTMIRVMVEQEKESYSFGEVSSLEEILLERWHVPTNDFSTLSGGEKLKARLAKGISSGAELLLLDEPTNHLDEDSTAFLIEQINHYKGTILFVSHDRYFLDQTATKIWSIENQKLIEHKGNYSSYMEFREQKRLSQQREYEKQQKMVERIQEQMNELSSWSNKAHAQSTKKEGFKEYYRVKAKRLDSQVKSKRKRLEKELEKAGVERVPDEYEVHFLIQAGQKTGKRFLELKNVSKSFDGKPLFQGVRFTMKYGEKAAIVGPNGSGKTTLLNIILGLESASGEVWVSPSANIGYLTQEVFDLPLEKMPEELFHQETFEARGRVQNLMKHLGFSSSQWKEPIANMSMGERVKCKLMTYILEEKDVLILDEPTNHLDLPSRERLEQTLSEYNGTLLVVSHDRYFLEKITNSQLLLLNGSVVRQWKESLKTVENRDELRLKLENEQQEVLGKLSFLTSKDQEYSELDHRFKELTEKIKKLKD